jgi:hypothetical protein
VVAGGRLGSDDRTKAVLAGLTAAAFLAASASSPSEATAFLSDVEDARGAASTATQWRAASAAEEIDDDEIPTPHRRSLVVEC